MVCSLQWGRRADSSLKLMPLGCQSERKHGHESGTSHMTMVLWGWAASMQSPATFRPRFPGQVICWLGRPLRGAVWPWLGAGELLEGPEGRRLGGCPAQGVTPGKRERESWGVTCALCCFPSSPRAPTGVSQRLSTWDGGKDMVGLQLRSRC